MFSCSHRFPSRSSTMPPRKSTKTLPAPADTRPQRNTQPIAQAALKLTSVVLALREEEESDSTTDSNSNSDNEESANTADESNSEAGDEDDSNSIEEVPIAVPQKRGKASKNTATPKSFVTHISAYCITS